MKNIRIAHNVLNKSGVCDSFSFYISHFCYFLVCIQVGADVFLNCKFYYTTNLSHKLNCKFIMQQIYHTNQTDKNSTKTSIKIGKLLRVFIRHKKELKEKIIKKGK